MLEGIRKNHAKRKRVLWATAAGLAIVVFATVAGFFFKEYQDVKNNPSAVEQAASQRIIEKVSDLYFVPQDEAPTVAQIQDKSKLEDQSFFTEARNGDYLLVYPKAKVALIYRENSDKLVNVGPVNTDQNQQADVAGESTE